MELVRIENVNGLNVVSSRVVAEQLGKEHKHVLRDIKEKSLSKFGQWIIPSRYRANNGQEYDEFLLTKDGFVMLVFNYDGYLEFKETYINEFNRMEKELNNKIKVPGTLKEALILALEQQEKIETLEIENKVKDQQIGELKPKATYYDMVLQCKALLSINIIAKDYGKTAQWLNEKLREFEVQYKQGNIWLLYQKYATHGYTQTKLQPINRSTGPDVKAHTYWTQKGRLFIYELLKKNGYLPNIEREYEKRK
ncbi:phage antirepressor KilAC domain-containing protein [Cetobacterium sp.]|uniref:phage antirepressor KilAC domain-containing protein n=1 Tax=Cetobacterium sp. TaxID=2071632 RepID=UPI003F363EF4